MPPISPMCILRYLEWFEQIFASNGERSHDGVRAQAVRLLRMHRLRIADARQVAEALVAADHVPRSLTGSNNAVLKKVKDRAPVAGDER